MNLVVDVEVRTIDIPRLKSHIGTAAAWLEVEGTLEAALRAIAAHPEQERECEYPPLLGYRKHKFHFRRRPSRQEKPDMRVIYVVRESTVVVLMLRVRLKGQAEDVYRLADGRLDAAGPPKTLETERLILRGWQESDAGEYYEIYRNPDVENAGVRTCGSVTESLEAVRSLISCQDSWAVVPRESGRLIGAMSQSNMSCQRIARAGDVLRRRSGAC